MAGFAIKTIKLGHLLIYFFIFLSVSSFAQRHYLLNSFTATKDKNRVILTWTMKPGASCFGIGILRASGEDDLKIIGTIPGICGSENEPMTYTYIDENPIANTLNRYVLELGFSGKTEPPLDLNFISLNNEKSKVVPNPVRSQAVIYFDNINKLSHNLRVFDGRGAPILVVDTFADFFDISAFEYNLPAGMYYYTIEEASGNWVTSGSYILIRD